MTATVTTPVTTTSSGSSRPDYYKHNNSSPASSLHHLPYPGLHSYSSHLNWQLHRNPRHAQQNYYESNSYYNAWFDNYKAQWRQHWQKFRGNLGTNLEKRSSSLLAVKCEWYERVMV